MVVQGHIALQRLLQVLGTVEVMGLENIGNTPIEALLHAIGFGRPGLGQPMLNAQRLRHYVELNRVAFPRKLEASGTCACRALRLAAI